MPGLVAQAFADARGAGREMDDIGEEPVAEQCDGLGSSSSSQWFNGVVLVGRGAWLRETGTLRPRRWRVRPHLVLEAVVAIRRVEAVGVKPQRRGQDRELRGGEQTQRSQRGVGVEPSAHRAHLGDAPGEVLGEQADDERQDVMDKTDSAPDPAHRPWKPDRIGA